jgi:hypothetical protein
MRLQGSKSLNVKREKRKLVDGKNTQVPTIRD